MDHAFDTLAPAQNDSDTMKADVDAEQAKAHETAPSGATRRPTGATRGPTGAERRPPGPVVP